MSTPNWKRAAAHMDAAAAVSLEQLLTAADVMRAIADVDLEPLRRQMTTDVSGNPITRTEAQRDAWATYCNAMERRDRARGWLLELLDEADRRSLDEGLE